MTSEKIKQHQKTNKANDQVIPLTPNYCVITPTPNYYVITPIPYYYVIPATFLKPESRCSARHSGNAVEPESSSWLYVSSKVNRNTWIPDKSTQG